MDLISVDEVTVAKVQASLSEQLREGDAPTILVNASHTHSGPATHRLHGAGGYNKQYIDRVLVPGLTNAIGTAFGGMSDGEIGIARTQASGLSYNRTGGTSLDTRVTTLRVDSDRHLVAGTHFPCHPVVYGKASTVVSSEYPGVAREILRRGTGAETGLWLTGCAGDIDPVVNIDRKNLTTREDVEKLGRTLGEHALDLYDDIELGSGELRTVSTNVYVPIDTDFELDPVKELGIFCELRRIPKTQDVSSVREWLKSVAPVVNGNLARTLPIPVTIIAIGRLVFAGFGAETYNQTGSSIERQNPGLNIVTMMTSNGHQGYVPPAGAYTRQEYAAGNSAFIFGRKPLKPESERIFRAGVNAALRQLAVA